MSRQKRKFVKVCPKCGSTNIGLPSLKSLAYRKGLMQPIVESGLSRCKNCGYHGIAIEVEEDNLTKLQKKLTKNRESLRPK